ncbi:MAG: hypothetical protein HY860_05710 [Chlamydiales bacterium]|nr:hypothetical protein [Chlamydiales bacterium]
MTSAIAITATPILNTPDFSFVYGAVDGSLLLDQKGFFRPLEMIVFPNTVFTVVKQHGQYILEVTTKEYLSQKKLFIDKRFVSITTDKPPERTISLPAFEEIKNKLLVHVGRPYVWGGNMLEALDKINEYYPTKQLSPYENIIKVCDGIDCSGLLYYATNGFVPRNTKEMCFFGRSIPIENKQIEDMSLKPLDMILDKGHVVFVLDERYCIQSKEKFGVYIAPTRNILSSLFRRKKPRNQWDLELENDIFIINRWVNVEE